MIERENALATTSELRTAWLVVLLVLLGLAQLSFAQTWEWETQIVDKVPGKFTSVAVDKDGNIHVSYAGDDGAIKYAYHPAGQDRWYNMNVEEGLGYTHIVVDSADNPHICYAKQVMKYAYFNGQKWLIQEIAPKTGPIWYSCGVGIAPDGTPHVSWYHEKNADYSFYLHFKYAILKEGAWYVRTPDFAGQTGKWESLVVDAQGNPHISYDSFVAGEMKYAYWNGEEWTVMVVDSRRTGCQYACGLGNSLFLDKKGQAHISYLDDAGRLRYARQEGSTFRREVVSSYAAPGGWVGYRTDIVLDSRGFPHIAYEDGGAVKHAWWDGKLWRFQFVVPPSVVEVYRYSAMTIDQHDTLYLTYRDPATDAVMLAIGRQKSAAREPATAERSKTALPPDRK